MAEKLEVQIGADISNLQKGINDAKKSMKSLTADQERLNQSFKRGELTEEQLAKETANLNNQYKKLDAQLKRDTQSLNNLSNAKQRVGKTTSANATPALTEFGRVIQDAPYGIQGVANNLNQLVDQFGYLQKSTGSSKKAFQAMVGALSGPAGIGVALGAVTSLIIAFGDEISLVNKKTRDLIKSQKDLTASAITEKAEVMALLEIAKDQNKTYDQRKVALEQAKSASDGYLQTLSLEKLGTEEATKAVSDYSNALLRNAKIQAIQEQLQKALANQFKVQKEGIEGAFLSLETFTNLMGPGVGAVQSYTKKMGEANEEVRYWTELYEPLIKKQKEEEVIIEDTTNKLNALKNSIRGVATAMAYTTDLPTLDFKVDATIPTDSLNTKQLEGRLVEIGQTGSELAKEAGLLIQKSFADTFATMGEFLGGLISGAGDGVEKGGAILLGKMGELAVSLGKMLIAYGVASEAFSKALASFGIGGIGAIVAGTALVAIGSAVKSTASRGLGGTSSGSSSSAPSVSTPSASSGYSGSSNSGGSGFGCNVVFEVQGSKLVGVLNNTLKKNKSLGGTNNLLLN